MKGRKPTPTALKILYGNPGKHRLAQGEPEPELGVPDPPGWLSEHARIEWQARAPGLCRTRVLAKDELVIFSLYCQAWGDVCVAREQIAEQEQAARERGRKGVLVISTKTKEGTSLRRNPLYCIAKESALDAARYAAELGLTPAARQRVATVPVGAERRGIRSLLYQEKQVAQ